MLMVDIVDNPDSIGIQAVSGCLARSHIYAIVKATEVYIMEKGISR
jgi:hypothetical protein